jgi:hypothetical protein
MVIHFHGTTRTTAFFPDNTAFSIYHHYGFFIKSGTAGSTAVFTHVYAHTDATIHASLTQPHNPRLHNEAPSLVRALSDTHNAVAAQHKHADDRIIRRSHSKLYWQA